MGRKDHVEHQHASTVTDPVRADTAVLFGAFCHHIRLAKRISSEGVEAKVPRVRSWYEALERGEFVPTLNMAKEVDNAFNVQKDSRSLRQTLIELELEPFGSLAESLRTRFGLPNYSPRSYDAAKLVGQGLSPIATSIRERDRLVVTGPFSVCAMLLSVQLALGLWSKEVLSDLALPALTAIAAVSVIVLSMSLPLLETVLRVLARAARPKKAKSVFSDLSDMRATAGLNATYPGAWHQDGESAHYLPGLRDDVARHALRADYFERMTGLFLVNVAASGLIISTCGFDGRGTVNVIALAVLVVITFIGTRSILPAVYSLEEAASLGLGLTSATAAAASATDSDSDGATSAGGTASGSSSGPA